MKILFVASECNPIVKVGGLGDVIGSLPIALATLGIEVEIVLPFYKDIDTVKFPVERLLKDIPVPFGGFDETINVYRTYLNNSNIENSLGFENRDLKINSIPVYLIENKRFLSGGGIYFGSDAFVDSREEIDRFAFFSRAVLEFIKAQRQKVDLVHCNDWHTGIIPNLLKLEKLDIATVFTIHNLANQGLWNLSLLEGLLISSKDLKVIEWDSRDQNLDLILQGILGADIISTVSPSYAKEVMTPEFGEGLDEVLKAKEGRVFGILNGIDTTRFNPATDTNIAANYSLDKKNSNFQAPSSKSQSSSNEPMINESIENSNIENSLGFENWDLKINSITEGKRINKIELQEVVGLNQEPDTPLIGMVTRISEQKGFEILMESFDKVLSLGVQFILLGLGDPKYEQFFKEKSDQYPGQSGVVYKFDAKLAQQIYAGADMFLMPSRFEPCGLGQMIAMRYGTIPIVRGVGGLKDSVKDGITGIVFKNYEGQALVRAVAKAVNIYQNNDLWQNMVENAMREDFSWTRSAREYVMLYEKAVLKNF